MEKKIWYIYGAGGLGRECLDIIKNDVSFESNNFEIRFLEDNPSQDYCNNHKIEKFKNHKSKSFITIAVGEPSLRKKLYEKIRKTDLKMRAAVHRSSVIGDKVKISKGAIIAPLCSIQANASIETNALINTLSIVGHDCVVKKHGVLSSMVNLGGSVRVGEGAFIGMCASIKENVKIGKNAIVSMTSGVYRDVAKDIIVVGNPARPSKMNTSRKVFKSRI